MKTHYVAVDRGELEELRRLAKFVVVDPGTPASNLLFLLDNMDVLKLSAAVKAELKRGALAFEIKETEQ